MNDKDLNEIQKRCDASTAGPWIPFIEGRDHHCGSDFIMTGEGKHRGKDIELLGVIKEDLDFIAHAKQDIPRLVKEVQRLKKLLNEA